MLATHCNALRHVALVAGAALGVVNATAQPYEPGQTYFGRSNYIEYIAGELPFILSAPHGGTISPAEMPNRTNCVSCPGWDFSTATDSNTDDLARRVRTELQNLTGLVPHIIICRLDRDKIDCNREIVEGAQGDPEAMQAWNEFQNWIISSRTNVVARHGRGFYIDLHGHGHTIQRLELGYLLTASQLALSDGTLNSATYENMSSIRRLSQESILSFPALLRGSLSFGALIENEGYSAVPSFSTADPAGNAYFNGGYNTRQHTSVSGGLMDGLQIESNYTGVRDTAANRTAFARALARVLEIYFATHYQINLRSCSPKIWDAGGGNWSSTANWANGALPVSTNNLVFAGAGGAVTHNLSALSSANGVLASLSFASNAAGAYSISGNSFSLIGGVTNNSAFPQTINSAVTLIGARAFAAQAGALVISGNITNPAVLMLTGSGGLTLNGDISGNGSVVKADLNTAVLKGDNFYHGGTTINQGTLRVDNSSGSGTGTGNVVVNANGILGGNGAIADAVSGSGTIAPGASVGSLTIGGGLDLSGGGTYAWELSALETTGAGTNFDQIVLTGGDLELGGSSKLQLNFSGATTLPDAANAFWQGIRLWKIISLTGNATNPGPTTFSSIENGEFAAGSFSTFADATGVWLKFVPANAYLAPVIVAAITGDGVGGATLAWSGVLGQTYEIQFKNDLNESNWQWLATLLGDGPVIFFEDTNSPPAQRFYRVVIP